MNNEIGFRPSRRCPVCNNRHEVKYQYKGVDILACPQMTEDKLVLMNEDYANDELCRLKNASQFIYSKIR